VFDDPETKRLANAYGVPVIVNSNIRDGSLRQAALEKGIPMLLFEGGEALRHEERVIQSALMGILSIMESIGMIIPMVRKRKRLQKEVFTARSSFWMRAPQSGSLRVRVKLGSMVKKGQILGQVSDPYGTDVAKVISFNTGIIIGMTMLPLVNKGDAIFHIATFENSVAVEERLEIFDEALDIDD
jgi:uncharacterized protein